MSHDDAGAIFQLVTEQEAAAQPKRHKPRRSIWADDMRTAEAVTHTPAENTHDHTQERDR